MTARDARFRALASDLEAWFARHQRPLPWRETYEPYRVWLSEVMLQQTRMEVVLEYYPRFVRRFPDIRALATAPEDEVLALWSGLGYYRRARMLRAAAEIVLERHDAHLPADFASLRRLPGLGRYTAGAIASIAFDQPYPVVEGNVTRLLSRTELLEEPAGTARLDRDLWTAAEGIVKAASSPRNVNQAMMEVGSLVCRPRSPRCPECPVEDLCGAAADGRAGELPRRRKTDESRLLSIPLYLAEDGAGRILMRRENGALMTAMYHLPHGNSLLLAAEENVRFRHVSVVGTFRHTVTNRRIEFTLIRAEAEPLAIADGSALAWIDPQRLSEIPHPSYIRKALALAGSAFIAR